MTNPTLGPIADHIRDLLGDDYDETTFIDTLDGETDAFDVMDQLAVDLVEAKAMEDAAMEMRRVYHDRAQRMANRQTNIRNSIAAILDAIKLEKVKRPLYTASRTKGRDYVVVTDADAVPTQLCMITKTPDKTAIKKQIDAGEDVPGATLETSPRGLQVRV